MMNLAGRGVFFLRQLRFVPIILLAVLCVLPASATTYYISTSGSDYNPGSLAYPWKTFSHATSRLRPGDTLIVRDGTYTGSNSGYIRVSCGSSGQNGTATYPITIQAEHERQAFVKGNGSANPVTLQHCSYWQLVGLHLEDGDYPHSPTNTNSVIELDWDSYLTFKRNILAHNNRYFNTHLVNGYYASHILLEENEFYYYHRHAVNFSYGGYNVVRRNYFNSRYYADIPGGRVSEVPDRGDSAISLYPDHDSIIENNIAENGEDMMDIEAAFVPYASDNEKFYGNISLGDEYGVLDKARGSSDGYTAHNALYQDIVIINPRYVGAYWRSAASATCSHCSFIVTGSSPISNFIADRDPRDIGSGSYAVNVNNSLAINATQVGSYGFFVNTASGGYWSGGLNKAHAYNNYVNVSARGLSQVNISSYNPYLGACLVWIPNSSPLKGAGSNGTDIGANVLHRYQNGVLTTARLWDAVTGQFPHGATVRGLNDVAGSSAFDVNLRLHVNSSGCSFPSGF